MVRLVSIGFSDFDRKDMSGLSVGRGLLLTPRPLACLFTGYRAMSDYPDLGDFGKKVTTSNADC